jgi:glycerate kinase
LRCLAAAHLPVVLVGVFSQPAVARVVNADNNQRLHFAGADGGIGVLANLPGAAGNERSARVEEVLPVLKIENRIGAVGLLVVARGHIDNEVTLVR